MKKNIYGLILSLCITSIKYYLITLYEFIKTDIRKKLNHEMLIDLGREYEDIWNPIDVFDTQPLSSN